MTFDDWQSLISAVVMKYARIIRTGGFLVANIGDIMCFPDPEMPRFQANNVRGKNTWRHT